MPVNRILIVEDDQALAEVLVYNLQQAGYQTLLANDGCEPVCSRPGCTHLI